jgi:hypothetical protein
VHGRTASRRMTRTVGQRCVRGGEKARSRRTSLVRGGQRDEAAGYAAKRSGPLTRAGEGDRRSVGPDAGGRRAQLVAVAPRKALAPPRRRADRTPAHPARSSLPPPRQNRVVLEGQAFEVRWGPQGVAGPSLVCDRKTPRTGLFGPVTPQKHPKSRRCSNATVGLMCGGVLLVTLKGGS